MDALVFEFMGLAMLALCVIVLAVPVAAAAAGTSATPDRFAPFERHRADPDR